VIVVRDVPALRAALGARTGPWALVPTMGALHAGHIALVTEARRRAPNVAASIFVNPTQFAANEDLSRYPRDEAGDLAALADAGCDLAWLPTVDVMYPPGDVTFIEVGGAEAGGPAQGFEGALRPGHFRGVATVVGKLLHQVSPAVAMFGEKDWQQLQVIRRMVADLHWPVEIAGVPTVREADGLAMSSRNRFLSAAERTAAPRVFAILQDTAQGLAAGDASAVPCGEAALRDAGFGVDYFALVEAASMRPAESGTRPARLITAARLGTVRLLDNAAVD
jgi:pantoate--beta-alanine ligase